MNPYRTQDDTRPPVFRRRFFRTAKAPASSHRGKLYELAFVVWAIAGAMAAHYLEWACALTFWSLAVIHGIVAVLMYAGRHR